MDLFSLVGKDVEIVLYRKHKYHTYSGRLSCVNKNTICLAIGGRDFWFGKPVKYKDSIKCLDEEE